MTIVQAIAYLFSRISSPNEDVAALQARVDALEAKVQMLSDSIGDMSEMPTIGE